MGLSDAVDQRVGLYSHGMQKRLSMARALLMDPPVLVIDEATDGLDPEGARRVQDLTRSIAADGTAVIWTTQRLDEIRGFADAVTVLDQGRTTFQGTVEDLMLKSSARGYLLRLRTGRLRRWTTTHWGGPRRRWAIAERWRGWAPTASTSGSTWTSTRCWARCWPISRPPVSSCSTAPSSAPSWRSRSCG